MEGKVAREKSRTRWWWFMSRLDLSPWKGRPGRPASGARELQGRMPSFSVECRGAEERNGEKWRIRPAWLVLGGVKMVRESGRTKGEESWTGRRVLFTTSYLQYTLYAQCDRLVKELTGSEKLPEPTNELDRVKKNRLRTTSCRLVARRVASFQANL